MGVKSIFSDRRFKTLAALILASFAIFGTLSFAGSQNKTKTDSIIESARSKLGSEYQVGAEGENKFDSAGFIYWVFQKKNNLRLSAERISVNDYRKLGKEVEKSKLEAGDLLFFNEQEGIAYHGAIYLGNNTFIHASPGYGRVIVSGFSNHFAEPKTKKEAKKAKTFEQSFAGARRIIGSQNTQIFSNRITYQKGDSGPAVREIQVDLNTLGYRLKADGEFEERMEEAVKDFQTNHFISANGKVDSKTLELIRLEKKTKNSRFLP